MISAFMRLYYEYITGYTELSNIDVCTLSNNSYVTKSANKFIFSQANPHRNACRKTKRLGLFS